MDEDRQCSQCEYFDTSDGRCGLKDKYVRTTDSCSDWSDWETRAIFGKGRRVDND